MHKIIRQEGFTLVEIIITIFIIAVTLLGILFGFSGVNSLAEKIADISTADKYIRGEMENARATQYENLKNLGTIEATEKSVEVQLTEPLSTSILSITAMVVHISSSCVSVIYPGKTTRAITFYICK